jgi:CMP-N-acetylneuraminic acid synthetase
MVGSKRLLAVIPARGGSKRLPRKNVLDLAGKPLIAWTIQEALNCKYIDQVIVSTDDKEISDISKEYGADVPFFRPSELATDEAKTVDVVLHLLDELEKVGERYDYIILLQPTSPLRTAQNIDESVELLQMKNSDAVISVCESEHPPLWCNVLPDDMSMDNFLDESVKNKRSQDLSKQYRINGAIYISSVKKLKKENSFFLSNNCIAYIMKQNVSIDIDTIDDFDFALLRISNSTNQKIKKNH